MVGASYGRVAGRDACVPSLLVITPPAEPAGTRPQRREEGKDAKLVVLHESWGPLGKRMYISSLKTGKLLKGASINSPFIK